MKRIRWVMNNERPYSYWDGEKLVPKEEHRLGSFDFAFTEADASAELRKARAFVQEKLQNKGRVVLWDISSDQEEHLFERENVEEIIANSESLEFVIYLETENNNVVICQSGERDAFIPQELYPVPGDMRIFTKNDLREGYNEAVRLFKHYGKFNIRGARKLHIQQMPVARVEFEEEGEGSN